jgi:formate-dependent nitrite reductase membrane component NrfD
MRMGRHRTAAVSLPAPWISAGISAVMAVVYLGVVVRQQHEVDARAVFVAVFLLVVAGLMLASFRVENPFQRIALLSAATNALIALGFLGLFSIGVPLLIAGAVAMPSVARALGDTPRPWGPTVAAMATLGAIAVIVLGLLAT